VKRAWAAPVCLVAACVSLLPGSSRARDVRQVQREVVGRGSALAACEGLDESNGSRARTDYPENPEVAFRIRLAGGIGQAPASDAHGNLVVVHAEPRLSKLDAKGRTLWSERLTSEASCAPVLTSSGSILIVTRDGEVQLFSPAGKLRAKRALPFSDPRRRSLAIPTTAGGALIASGSDLLQLDERGVTLRELHANGNLTTIAEANATLVAVSENGSVSIANATGDMEMIGSFAGNVSEGAAVADGRVLAVVDGHKWSALDLASGQVTTLANEGGLTLTGPPGLLDAPSAALVAEGGFVSVRAKDGHETSRVSLSATSQSFDPTLRGLRAALVVSDRQGTIAAVRSGNDVLLLAADGNVRRLEDTACLDPFRPTPTPRGLVFACRSGQLFGISGKAR